MNIHKEGYKSIALSALVFGAVNIIFFYFFSASLPVVSWIVFGVTFFLLLFIISFFRSPKRNFTVAHHQVICPADGKVVVIEEITDTEYFHDKRIQVSIFMSPANVHLNRIPMTGAVEYSNYHNGKYLVAWNPKSST
jgi:phosphatidylserine decarboxylase